MVILSEGQISVAENLAKIRWCLFRQVFSVQFGLMDGDLVRVIRLAGG